MMENERYHKKGGSKNKLGRRYSKYNEKKRNRVTDGGCHKKE
jgi:hypothetical protein